MPYLQTVPAGEVVQQAGTTMALAAWGAWVQNSIANVYTYQNMAWYTWTSGATTAQTAQTTNVYIYNPAVIQSSWAAWQAPVRRKESEAERKAREEAEFTRWAEYTKAQAAAAAEAAKARARAEKILVRHLSEDQKKVLAEKGYFEEEINGKTYRIWRGTHGNIKELDKDKQEVAQLCVQPAGVPTEDAMLAQLLWLRADEKALLRVANRTVFERPVRR